MQEAEVCVIIVNYGTASLALEAAESVLSRHHGGRSVEVHIVDNNSPGDDAQRIAAEIVARSWEGRVTFHHETENLGFARGNNLVLKNMANRRLAPRYAFLLNPDATLENEAIAVLADFLDAHPKAAAAGARIEKPGAVPVTAAFRFPGLIGTFEGALGFGPVSRLFASSRIPLAPDAPTGKVGWVAGAAVMMRLSEVEKAGFFDPAYFLYYEEVDLMLQLTRQGGEVWYVAEARVIHAEGVATGVKSGDGRRRRPAYWYQSWLHYFRKNHGRAGAIGVALAWTLGATGNMVIAALRRRTPSAPLRFFGDFWAQAGRPLIGLKPLPHD